MEAVFLKILNMSITASWLILAVVILRFILKKTPKWQICALWVLVAVRLICPFSVESALSLIPSTEPIPTMQVAVTVPTVVEDVEYISTDIDTVVVNTSKPETIVSEKRVLTPTYVASLVWVVGIGVLLGYMLVSFLRIRKRTAVSVRFKDNIFVCDEIETPFILGTVRPRIYIPSTLDEAQRNYVLAHERAHLKRLDNWWKILGYLILIVHWFNPLCWLAYILFARDIEFACDEKVIGNYDLEDKKAYSLTLLHCGMSRKNQLAWPVAFGEVGVKERVKGVLNYKKPSFWIIVITFVVGVIVAVCFLTNPVDKTEDVAQETVEDGTEEKEEDASDVEDKETLEQTYKVLEQWAQAFIERDAKGIVALSSEEVEASFRERELLMGSDGQDSFGMSSSWPVDVDNDYKIYQYDETKAEVYYYARTSDPHITCWKETLEYEWIDNEFVITDEQLTYFDDISSGAEFEEAYHGLINDTMMDYTYNGLGRVLNEHVLASSLLYSEYSDLCIPEKAAIRLLNLSDDSEKVVITRRKLKTEDLVGLDILFEEDDVVVTISMMRPYDSMGIWVPVNFTVDVVARFMNVDWSEVQAIPFEEQIVSVDDILCIGEIPEKGIRVYGYNDEETACNGVAIDINGDVNYFDWTYISPHAILPKMYWNEASKQLQIAFYIYTGTEASAYNLYVLQYHDTGTLTPYNFDINSYEKVLRNTIGWNYEATTKELVLFEKSSNEEITRIEIPEGTVNGLALGNISDFTLGETIMLSVETGYYTDISPHVGQYENMPKLEFEVVMNGDNDTISFDLEYLSSSLNQEEVVIQDDGGPLSLRKGLVHFKKMTYEEYKNEFGEEAEFYHANRYIAPILDGEAEIVFDAGAYDEDLAMSVLDNSDNCLRLEGNLGVFVEGLVTQVSIEEFCQRFERASGAMTEYAIMEGEMTAYYVSDNYVAISFDSDGDAHKDAVLEVELDNKEKIGPNSTTWLHWGNFITVDEFSFGDVENRRFYFASGAGGWSTELYIYEDGTFEGVFSDTDMGSADLNNYPNGTIYYSEFIGKFTEPVRINDNTYAFKIESIEYPLGLGEEIKDGYFYDYETAYGLNGAEELYMYLPGAKLADLPEEYLSWVGYYNLNDTIRTELPFYGLYNVTEECGFSS